MAHGYTNENGLTFYTSSANLPPGHVGMTVGFGYWMKVDDSWYSVRGITVDGVHHRANMHRLKTATIDQLDIGPAVEQQDGGTE